ncbi:MULTISPECIES: hypothetical protein [unclassified Streptomyces]|uniref:hypothetical protein n=1 Tax=unclassified Streptomyces TaxID=2593676 RepID=UPI0004C8AA42|nr:MULTISPECIES: hypothetical protein [unclassified Streptomyces]AQT72364.1 hypothetical protein B1K54_12360 [Streptomyces sp. fd1-xmd]
MPYRARARAADERRLAPPRRSVTRLRLTCLYAGVFMLAGTAFVTVVLLLAEQAVSRGSGPLLGSGSESRVVLAPADCPGAAVGGPSCPPLGQERPHDPLFLSAVPLLAVLGPLSVGAGYVTAGYALSRVRRITRTARGAYRDA